MRREFTSVQWQGQQNMREIILLALGLAAVAALPTDPQRIIGGSVTTINQYPHMAALLYSLDLNTYFQACGGVVLNTKSVLTAAHCPERHAMHRWRFRVGSTWANSGGVVHILGRIIIHPNYNSFIKDCDIAIFQSSGTIVHSNVVRPAQIAGPNYNLADNQVVWAAGWGHTAVGGPSSEQLRHVQVWTINIYTCDRNYSEIRRTLTANMLCTGWLNVGGRDQCQGDSGGPVYHNGVVVGICSFGHECGLPRFPGVSTRVSRFSTWIQANA